MRVDNSGLEPECVNCGARLAPDTPHCPVCGLPARVEYQQRRCPNCGTPAAQRAQTCLMCNAPLDRVSIGGGLGGVSWPWIGAVALIAALVAVGWNHWRSQEQHVAAAPTATLSPTDTPTLVPRTATPTPTITPSPSPSPTPVIHEVQSGETVIYIASYYGISPEAIMEANGLDETSVRLLRPGQKLLIPSTGPVGGPVPGSTLQAPQVIHEVKSGEALLSIADEYGTTVEAIMAANNLDSPDLIYAGQQLIVPLMPPTSTPTPTPTPTPTSTPGPPYAAPHLLSPPDDTVVQGEDVVILLSWTSVGILRDNQAYLVELETPAHITPITHTTQGTAWRIPSDLWPTGRRRGLSWRVTVVEHSKSSSSGLYWKPLSLPSETRHFVWW